MAVPLDLQVRLAPIGRIRLGLGEPTGKTGRGGQQITRPVKLGTFRFTSPSRPAIDAAAALHHGDVRPWEYRGRRQWEVITGATELMVCVPQVHDAIDSWYEWWRGGECVHRCDSRTDIKTGRPCICPADPVERHRLSKANPPQACGLKTRVSLILPDVGTWRLDTGSFHAAGQLLSKTRFMEMFKDRAGFMLPARLWIDHQSDMKDGRVRRWTVPALELQGTLRQYAGGQLGSGDLAAQLPGGPGQPPRALGPAAADGTSAPDPDPRLTAQHVADLALTATTRAEVERLAAQAKQAGLREDAVFASPVGDPDAAQIEQPLWQVLTHRWRALPAA